VLTRLFVVLFVEAADELLEDRPNAVVIQAGVLFGAIPIEDRVRAQVDVR